MLFNEKLIYLDDCNILNNNINNHEYTDFFIL